MANPLDRQIEAALRRGREPESWKRPGSKQRETVTNQQGTTGQGQPDKPPGSTGLNRPGQQR